MRSKAQLQRYNAQFLLRPTAYPKALQKAQPEPFGQPADLLGLPRPGAPAA